jgi:hypothetical protein
VTSNSEHEALIARFLEKCEQATPELYREVCERHTVLSVYQMERRARKETCISQFDGVGMRSWLHGSYYSDSGTDFSEEAP